MLHAATTKTRSQKIRTIKFVQTPAVLNFSENENRMQRKAFLRIHTYAHMYLCKYIRTEHYQFWSTEAQILYIHMQ